MHKGGWGLGQSYVLRLPPGEDLLTGLYRVCREHEVEFGTFEVMGAVRNATLGHLDQETGEVRPQVLAAGQDLVVCNGNISPQGDSFRVRAFLLILSRFFRVSRGFYTR